LLVFLPSEIKG